MTSYGEPPLLTNASTLTNTDASAAIMRRQDVEDCKPAAVEPVPVLPSTITNAALPVPTTATNAQRAPSVRAAPALGPTTSNAISRQPDIASEAGTATTSSTRAAPQISAARNTNNTTNASAFRSKNNIDTTSSNHHADGSSPEVNAYLQNMVRQELQDHMFTLKEDIEGSIRNLHVDMIRQFHRQSQEMMSVVRHQQQQIDQLMQQNEFLREQNGSLLQQNGGVPQNQHHHDGGGKNGYK